MQNLFLVTVKLIEYVFYAVSVCIKPCLGPFPRIKMSFFLKSTWPEELISTPKIITFWPNQSRFDPLSNPVP